MSDTESNVESTAKSFLTESVDFVDSDFSDDFLPAETATSCGTNAGGTELVLAPKSAADLVDHVDSESVSEASVLEPYAVGGAWHYAEALKGRCFEIVQDEKHPDTGAILLTRERIEKVLAKRPNDLHSWVRHDRDQYTDEDLVKNPRAVLGEYKVPHFHIAEKRKNEASVGQVARAYDVAPQYVRVKPITAFLDLVDYQTHGLERQQDLGKNLYDDSEIHANFAFREEVDKRVAKRINSGTGPREGVKQTPIDKLAMRIQEDGLTLRLAKEEDPLSFNRAPGRMEKSRATYLRHLPPPSSRINFYFEGEGGVGKDLLAKALARTLIPGNWVPGVNDPFFSVGGENVGLDGYDGQPVIIFEEARAGNLIRSMGRKELFAFMNPFPEKQSLNVKYGATQPVNTITIFTGPDDYDTFLDGLAGEFIDKSGERHKAENKPQARRRIPIIIPVREGSFDLLVNKGFADNTRDFMEYHVYRNIRQNIEQVQIRSKGILDEQRRIEIHRAIEAGQVAPIVEQYHRVLEVKASKDEDPDALIAEFSNLGKTIPEEELEALAHNQFLDDLINAQRIELDEIRAADERQIAYTLHRLGQHQAGRPTDPINGYLPGRNGRYYSVSSWPIVDVDDSASASGLGEQWVLPWPALEEIPLQQGLVAVESEPGLA
ncbi:hypothetical protein MB46_18565 [Arthrobacter alpinus]|uniref:hypothetical protein n=1 Tax=Arthrobacter alpinus TaxID=656366 RepID=UPI0005C88970|nr:hypothetical protein [Arthrobacter alpinus]ALV47196.1 hypothetical protein MB46_18565 [Arthrobacter alpinus]